MATGMVVGSTSRLHSGRKYPSSTVCSLHLEPLLSLWETISKFYQVNQDSSWWCYMVGAMNSMVMCPLSNLWYHKSLPLLEWKGSPVINLTSNVWSVSSKRAQIQSDTCQWQYLYHLWWKGIHVTGYVHSFPLWLLHGAGQALCQKGRARWCWFLQLSVCQALD